MLTILKKLFGKKSEKKVKELLPLVQKINEEYGKLSPLSNDELRDKTRTFKQRIAESLEKVDAEIADLKKQGEAEDLHVHEKVTLYDRVDKLEKERNKELEVALLDLLPEAPLPVPCYARSEEHTSELPSLMRISYAVFCLKKKKHIFNPSIQQYIPPRMS